MIRQRGQALAEWLLITALVGLLVIAALWLFGDALRGWYESIAGGLGR